MSLKPIALLLMLAMTTAIGAADNCPLPTEPLAGGEPDPGFLAQYGSTYRFRMGRPRTDSIRFTDHGDKVLFLRADGRSFETRLFEQHVESGKERQLLTAEQLLSGDRATMTAEEKARRERKRLVARGITSFQVTSDERLLLIPLSGRLFLYDRRERAHWELMVTGPVEDPRLSPDDKSIAYVHAGDLYVVRIESGEVTRLTDDAGGPIHNALAEFVAQEEMSRYRGFWWSPDSQLIAYQQTDTTGMETLNISDPTHPQKAPDVRPYPRAGKKNAKVKLGVIPATGGTTRWIEWNDERYPYLAAVVWEEDAPLTFLVQNRHQTEEMLLAVHRASNTSRTLHVENDKEWLEIDERMPKWFAKGSAFLWTTERDGYRQFEIRNRNGTARHSITPLHPGYRTLHHLDEERKQVYVSASPDSSQAHLHRFSTIAVGADPERLSKKPGMHAAYFGGHGDLFVHHRRTMDGEEFLIRHVDGRLLGQIESRAEVPTFAEAMTETVQFTRIGERKRRFAVATVVPRSFDPERKYPVIVHVYGGPTSVMVQQSRSSFYLDQWIADHGYIVVRIDGRGTPNRDRAWLRAVKGDLIDIPLRDQSEGLERLGRACPNLDMNRVGIYGWSFGGYFSAMAAMRRPDLFHAGVAGAPVTDWADYDTHYTERYMGLPQENKKGYRDANVLTYAPELTRPLLIIHGTSDDNVLFTHSLKMADALFRAGKPFDFLPLSGFTHIVPEPVVSERLYTRMMDFFQRNVRNRAVSDDRAARVGADQPKK